MADKKAAAEAAKAEKAAKKRQAAEEKARAKAEAKAKKAEAALKKKAAKAEKSKGKGKKSPSPSPEPSSASSASGAPSNGLGSAAEADDGFNPSYKPNSSMPAAASAVTAAAEAPAPKQDPPTPAPEPPAAAAPEPEKQPEPTPPVVEEPAPAEPAPAAEPAPEPVAAPESDPEPEPEDDGEPEEEPEPEPISDANSEPPPSSLAEVSGSGRGGGIKRKNSARRSVMGAPMSKAEGVKVVEAAPEAAKPAVDDESRLGHEVVEDEADEQVGMMTDANAQLTAQFLSNEYNSLKARMIELYAEGTNRGYSVAYQAMGHIGRDQPSSYSDAEENRLKNRYGNIMAYDHSRVELTPSNNDPATTYVNANWINGYARKREYIASQGPVPNSFISHWRMIWQEKVEIIVMVTHEVEGNRMKCHRYWPDPTSRPPVKTLQFGQVYVTHLSSTPHKHYVVRDFEIMFEGETRKLKQFAYTSWPDHGVPLTTQELLGFRNAINSAVTNPDVPQLIHCSAGVGRTGTYIAIDRIMKQCLDMGGEINIDEIVKDMRMSRNFMVQTEVQYMFIYRAVLDAVSELLSGESSKAQQIQNMDEVRFAAEQAKREEDERNAAEQAMIEEAKKELLAREANSAEAAAQIVGASIKDRIKMLESSEERWLKAYTQSLEEWNERNKFEAEIYDLTSALTPLQSRLEALRQKGMAFE